MLIRHGAAAEADRDEERALSQLGRSEVTALRDALERRGVHVDRILHSELRRARETAEILAALCSASPSVRRELAPDGDPDVVVAELEELRGRTLVVSHLPFLPRLCEELLGEITALPDFRTATAVCLGSDAASPGRGAWSLKWSANGRDELLRR